MDRRQLLNALVHPKDARAGDFVLAWGHPEPPGPDIVRVVEVTRNGFVRLEGREKSCRRSELLPPTDHRKAQHLECVRLAALPVVGAFVPATPLAKYPPVLGTSPHVVGRPDVRIAALTVARSPSDYLDVRFDLRNDGPATVVLGEYHWDYDAEYDPDLYPFAYLGDDQYKVFCVERAGKLYPEHTAHLRVSVSNHAGPGSMRLFVPSGILGGAVGTFTLLVFDAPPPGRA